MEKYTIYANCVEELQKVFNRYAKKAEKIGLKPSLTIGEKYPKKCKMYAYDEITHTTKHVDDSVVEVCDVEIYFPEYKLGDYTVAAVIEHDEKGNLVYPYGDNIIPMEYTRGQGICEHCRTNHARKRTILLIDKIGKFRQVGTNCVKEYTGVNDYDLIRAFQSVETILLDSDIDGMNEYKGTSCGSYTETAYYLAKCIHYTLENGYTKECKYEACEIKPNDKDNQLAEKVMEYFAELETTDTFMNNIKLSLSREYTKRVNGFIAYAFTAYTKDKEKAKQAETKKISEHYGKVGDKIVIDVTGKCITSYPVSYGYYNSQIVCVFKFVDKDNHVFIWKTSSGFAADNQDRIDNEGVYTGKIKAKIKEHSEYKGEKQTIITWVKAV